MKGYRNLTMGVLYIAACVYLGHVAGAEQVTQMAGAFSGLGVGVVGVVGARAANKWAEAKNGGVQ